MVLQQEKTRPSLTWQEYKYKYKCTKNIMNTFPTKNINMNVPKLAWCARKPFVKHLKVFGSFCFQHIPDKRRTKLQDKSEKMIFIGYHSICAYKLYNPIN